MRFQVVRPEPGMSMGAYKTYAVATPPRTHFRPASCEEYLCQDFLYGFITTLDLATDIGVELAEAIKHDKMRTYHEIRTGLYEARFEFPPGTPCWNYRSHKVPVDKPPILYVRGGDWRGSTGLIRRHTDIGYWCEDFAEHQDGLAKQFNG